MTTTMTAGEWLDQNALSAPVRTAKGRMKTGRIVTDESYEALKASDPELAKAVKARLGKFFVPFMADGAVALVR